MITPEDIDKEGEGEGEGQQQHEQHWQQQPVGQVKDKHIILMAYKEKKERHIQEQVVMQRPVNGVDFAVGDYVSLDSTTMTVYNRDSIGFNPNALYGFVSFDEVMNNGNSDHIKVVRFRRGG